MTAENSSNQAETTRLTVSHQMDGQRIDQTLARAYPDYSRAYFQRGIKAGHVLLNDRPCRPADKVSTNDVITVTWPEDKPIELHGEPIAFDVLWEDEDVIVLNKPPGLVVHPAKGNWEGTLVHALLAHDEESFRKLVDEDLRPGIVHRLDKDTSGVMVVAKHERSRMALSRSFRERQVEKTYLAVTPGEFARKQGTISAPIGRHPRDRKKMAVVGEKGKHAVTHYHVLAGSEEATLVEVRIETGRTHQIRVHLASICHPVLGDPVYGGRQARFPAHVPRQMLHAWKLAFPHPSTGKMNQYIGDLPADFQRVLIDLGLPVIGPDRKRRLAGHYGKEFQHDTHSH